MSENNEPVEATYGDEEPVERDDASVGGAEAQGAEPEKGAARTPAARKAGPPAGTVPSSSAGDYQWPYIPALIAAVAVWALYAITLAPTTAFWDTSEYIATAHIMGVPHPPGNPTFVILARAWELLLAPFGLSVAVRINLFSATMGALAHGCWFLVAHRIVAWFTEDRSHRLIGASLAVLVSATAFTVWSQSNVNEKVYTVSLATIAIITWLAFLWRDHLGRGKDDNLLLLIVFILALSVGNHLMAFLVAPALLVFILLVESKTLTNWKLYAFAAVVALIGLSTHLFLPLRASLDPIINEADPSTLNALWESLTRQQYDKPSIFADPTDPAMPRGIGLILAQIGNYFQYFDWQWARSLNGEHSLFGGLGAAGGGFAIRPLLTLVFAALGLYGAWEHYHRDRKSWWYLTILFATVSIGLVGYLNFRYGYTYPQPDGGYTMAMHEVRERDYFFMVSFSMWGLWAGIGIFALWRRLADRLADDDRLATSGQRYALASPILVLAILPLILNWPRADRSDDYAARDWAYNVLMSVEPYGVLFTNGDNDTFPLWYLQEVEGIRRDVTVIVMSYLNTPWYAKQLKDLTDPCEEGEDPLEDPTRIICQRPFQPENSAGYYAAEPGVPNDTGAVAMDEMVPSGDTTGAAVPGDAAAAPADDPVPPGGWQKPERGILTMSYDRIDSIPMLYNQNPYNFMIEEPVRMQAGQISFTVPGQRVLLPADVFMLNIIQSALGDRPVYFATTTQSYNRVGLGRNLVRQGVALKLSPTPLEPNAAEGIYALPEEIQLPGDYIDLPRTDSLLWNVFVHRGGIPDEWRFWPEPSTTNIPVYYAYAHYAAYAAHSLLGQEELAARHAERAEAWSALSERR
ncbi:MAG: glycosyltransferase family 117 protein [Candidatus Longimicrobiales bacterium M2_2A_002]